MNNMLKITLSQSLQDGRSAEGYLDFMVYDSRRRLYVLSMSGRPGSILDARAILGSRNTRNLEFTTARISRLEFVNSYLTPVHTRPYYPQSVGYRVAMSRMDDAAHLIAVSKLAFGKRPPFLLMGVNKSLNEVLEQHLKEKTAVPFLPEWVDWIARELMDRYYLYPLEIHSADYLQGRYNAWLLEAGDDVIQDIVSMGLRNRYISMGEIDHSIEPLTSRERLTLTDYIRSHREDLANIITRQYEPLFDPSRDNTAWDEKSTKKRLLRAQADVVQAVLEVWKRSHWSIVVGEMGVGKGLIGPTAVYADANGKPFRALVLCPGHLVEKWKREIESTIPDAHVEIIRSWKDLCHRDPKERPTRPEYLIVSRSRAKLHYFERSGAVRIERRSGAVVYKCPRCGIYLPDRWNMERKGERNIKCPECREKLWQADNSRKPRYSIAKWISKRMKGWLDYLIIDELHEDKAGDSSQGEAMGQLVGAAKKVLGLTGTLLGGYADDLFYLLFRLDPKKMKSLGFSYGSVQAFNDQYGTVQQIRRRVRGSTRAGQTQYRRMPGVSPMIFPTFLMDNTCFIDLSDLGYDLPEYTEHVHLVDMDEELEQAYTELETALRVEVGSVIRRRLNVSGYLNSMLAYPDHPYLDRPIVRRNPNTGEETVVFEPRILDESVVRNKEQELIWLVQAEKERGRRCYVYVNYTGDFKALDRVASILRGAGFSVATLTSQTVPQEQREAWIADQVEKGVDVIVSHPRLVQTGLDLYDFPTIIVYQTGMSIYTLRQAIRRSWRIGQTQPVQVHFLCYRNTLQEDLLRLMGAKLEAATTLEGKFSDEGLRAMAVTEDMTSALARALVEGLHDVDSAEAIWARAAERNRRMQARPIKPQPVSYAVYTVSEMIEKGLMTRTKKTLLNQLAFDFAV